MSKAKYILQPGAPNVTIWVAEPPYKREDKGKFELHKLSEQDLEYLHSLGYTHYVLRSEPVATTDKKKKD